MCHLEHEIWASLDLLYYHIRGSLPKFVIGIYGMDVQNINNPE